MKLKEIDKARYSKHLKIVFSCIVVTLLVITLGVSTLIIQFFSTPDVSHLWHNLAGVAIAATIVIFILNKLRQHPFMLEVVYVWDLKQMLNRIYRKQRKIETAAENSDHDAMIIMNFQYRGSKQLYQLDDNTITIDNLVTKMSSNDHRMEAAGMSLSTDSFEVELLEKF